MRRIDYDHPLAKAARDLDEQCESEGFDACFASLGLDRNDVIYMAQQRALRMALISVGRSDLIATDKLVEIPPGVVKPELLQALTITCLDGIITGWKAALDA